MVKKPDPVDLWRFQRDRINPLHITGMNKERTRFVYFKLDGIWKHRFGSRDTLYARAIVSGTVGKPHIVIVNEVQQW